MKATLNQKQFALALSRARKIIGKGSMPILQFIRLDAAGEHLTIAATDLDSFIRIKIPAQVDQEGAAMAPEVLAGIASNLPEDWVILESAGTLKVESGKSKYKLATMPVEDFPDWPEFQIDTTAIFNQADLHRAISNASWARPDKDSRRILCGTLFKLNGALDCIATDGRLLGSDKSDPVEVRGQTEREFVIPSAAVDNLKSMLGEGEAVIEFGESKGRVKIGDVEFIFGRIEGTYPKYEAVIPTSFNHEIKFKREELIQAVKRAAYVSESVNNSIIFELGPEPRIVAQKEGGEHSSWLPCAYEGEPFKIAFGHINLMRALNVIGDENILMKIKEPDAPVVIKCESAPDALFMVMPVRLGEPND